jgi:protein phosphatase
MTLALPPSAQSVDQRHRRGPFDVIGDVHGCADEFEALLDRLGYVVDAAGARTSTDGRLAVFVGDLADRGPRSADALLLAMSMVASGSALWVTGNHDAQLERFLGNEPTPVAYGLDTTLAEIADWPGSLREELYAFLASLPGHYVLDGGQLVVAHTGLGEAEQGDSSARVRRLAAYGVAEGEVDPSDRSKRHSWAAAYRGAAAVVYGHTAVPVAQWRQNSIDIDTGCVFGGQLTALRWPERELVAVSAVSAYAEPPQTFQGV